MVDEEMNGMRIKRWIYDGGKDEWMNGGWIWRMSGGYKDDGWWMKRWIDGEWRNEWMENEKMNVWWMKRWMDGGWKDAWMEDENMNRWRMNGYRMNE